MVEQDLLTLEERVTALEENMKKCQRSRKQAWWEVGADLLLCILLTIELFMR